MGQKIYITRAKRLFLKFVVGNFFLDKEVTLKIQNLCDSVLEINVSLPRR